MKKLFLPIIVILFLAIIISGHIHWKSVITQNAKKAEAQVEIINNSDSNQDTNKDKQAKATSQPEQAVKSNINFDKLTKSLPDSVKNLILNAQDKHKQVTIVLAGGKAISGLTPLLQSKLDQAYGKDFFKVVEDNFQEQNSLAVYQNNLYTSLVGSKPDIVVFTPMLINDNGKVSSHDSARVPILIGSRLKELSPNTIFMIEPPNPVTFNVAINDRVNEIKTEAENEDYEYIDHLSAWPTDEDLNADLDDQGVYPNDKGLKVWSDYLAGYFTSSN